jgi:hypothetical protein
MNTADLLRPWNADQCADYLSVSKSHFLQCVQHAEGFPAPLPAYTYQAAGRARRSQPEWSALDVVTWRIGDARLTRITQQLRNEPVSA